MVRAMLVRIPYIGRGARCVQYRRARVRLLLLRLALPLSAAMLGRRLGRREEGLVDLHEDLGREALAEADQGAVRERASARKRLQANKVLEIRVLRHGPDQGAVAQPGPLLYDQRAKRHAHGERGMAFAGREVPRVELLRGGPVDGMGETAPSVAHVELHAAGLVEVVEGDLVAGGGFVHGLAA